MSACFTQDVDGSVDGVARNIAHLRGLGGQQKRLAEFPGMFGRHRNRHLTTDAALEFFG